MADEDELYTVAPGEFTAARKRIEKQLREAGDTAGAARVKALRKPPITVWAVNQLARRKPEEIAELLKVSDELRNAQAAALHGRESDFLELGRKQRSEVGRLVGLAGTLAREAGHATPPSFARRVGATIQAAALGDAETLRKGRLTEELTPAATFGTAGGKAELAKPPAHKKHDAAREKRERERERQRERERERKLEKLKKIARAARAEATKRRRTADAAVTAAERAERAADAAEAAVRSAERG